MNIEVSFTLLKIIQDRLDKIGLLDRFLFYLDEFGEINPTFEIGNVIFHTDFREGKLTKDILREYPEFGELNPKILDQSWSLIVLDIIDNMEEWREVDNN